MYNENNIENGDDEHLESVSHSDGKQKKKRGIPVWALVFSILLAVLMTFQATYITLTVKYDSEIKKYRSGRSSVSSSLGKAYSLIDEISGLFEKYYVYDVDYDSMIEELVAIYVYETGDKYAEYYSREEWEYEQSLSEGVSAGVGITVYPLRYEKTDIISDGIYVTQVMSDGPAREAGIERGDVIIAIDGKDIRGMHYLNAYALSQGEAGTVATYTVVRDGETIDFVMVRGTYSYETVFYRTIESDGKKIGYIRLTDFYEVTCDEFKMAVRDLKKDGCCGLIYDIRSNGGGYLGSITSILDYILPAGPIVKITYSDGTEEVYSSDTKCISDLPMVVLIDDDTASAAELFAAALKDYDYATLIGDVTYGKGCGQNIIQLSNGGYVKFTTFFYSPPFSGNYDGVGVIPDIEVKLDGKSDNKNALTIKDDEDNQLAVAIETILNKTK